MPVDNSLLQHWHSLDAAVVLRALAEHARPDPDFRPRKDRRTTRWHACVGGREFTLVITGPKFFDDHTQESGGGAIDLAMHVLRVPFSKAVKQLKARGI